MFFPQRQIIVLLTDKTIRELCSRTTPTSQFSSLHFIASKAIGAKSIERRAQGTRHRHLTQSSAGRIGANVWRPTRFGADCRSAGSFPTSRGDTTATICQASRVGNSVLAPRLAHRTGGWRLKHAPLPLPYCLCYGGSTSHCESPPITFSIVIFETVYSNYKAFLIVVLCYILYTNISIFFTYELNYSLFVP